MHNSPAKTGELGDQRIPQELSEYHQMGCLILPVILFFML
jgi:hypothetical protein